MPIVRESMFVNLSKSDKGLIPLAPIGQSADAVEIGDQVLEHSPFFLSLSPSGKLASPAYLRQTLGKLPYCGLFFFRFIRFLKILFGKLAIILRVCLPELLVENCSSNVLRVNST